MTRGRLTDDEQAQVMDRILDAAKRCFASRGVELTKIGSAVAAEAEVSRWTLSILPRP